MSEIVRTFVGAVAALFVFGAAVVALEVIGLFVFERYARWRREWLGRG